MAVKKTRANRQSPKNYMKIAYDAAGLAPNLPPTIEQIRAKYGPCETLGYVGIDDVRTAQDSALEHSYTLLQHSLAHGLFDVTTQFIGYGVLSRLTQDGLIRAGVEMRADEMTRKWIELTYSGQNIKKRHQKTESDEEGPDPINNDSMVGFDAPAAPSAPPSPNSGMGGMRGGMGRRPALQPQYPEGQGEEEEKKAEERNDLISIMNKEMDKFRIRKLFRDVSAMCGYFGGCLVYIDVGDIDEDELKLPLRLDSETFEKGSLRGFRIIEPYNIAPGQYDARSPLSKNYYKPRSWYIMGQEVHASRFLYFSEDKPPTLLLPSYNFFGIPLAQTVLDTVTHFTTCREAVARMLEKFSLTVMKTDMAALLAGGSDGDIRRRIEYFLQNRSQDGMMVIDNDSEDILTISTPFSGATDIVKQSMEMVAAYFGEPVVKLWGISPSGLNSTGEADMQNHFDHINSIQERILRTPLLKCLKILQMNKLGKVNKSLTFDFLPLGDENDLTVAQVQSTKVGTMVQLFDRGIIDGEEARQALADDSKSPFSNIDLDKEVVPPGQDDEQNPLAAMMGGMGGGGEEEQPQPNPLQAPQQQQAPQGQDEEIAPNPYYATVEQTATDEEPIALNPFAVSMDNEGGIDDGEDYSNPYAVSPRF